MTISNGDHLTVRSVVATRPSVAINYDRTRPHTGTISIGGTGDAEATAAQAERSRSIREEAITIRIHYDALIEGQSLLLKELRMDALRQVSNFAGPS